MVVIHHHIIIHINQSSVVLLRKKKVKFIHVNVRLNPQPRRCGGWFSLQLRSVYSKRKKNGSGFVWAPRIGSIRVRFGERRIGARARLFETRFCGSLYFLSSRSRRSSPSRGFDLAVPFEREGGLNNTHELFFGVPIYSHDPGSSDYVLRFKSSLYASLRATSPPSGLTCEMAAAPLTSRNFYDFLLASGGVA